MNSYFIHTYSNAKPSSLSKTLHADSTSFAIPWPKSLNPPVKPHVFPPFPDFAGNSPSKSPAMIPDPITGKRAVLVFLVRGSESRNLPPKLCRWTLPCRKRRTGMKFGRKSRKSRKTSVRRVKIRAPAMELRWCWRKLPR